MIAYLTENTALIQKNERWHFCILKGAAKTQIDTLNFVNPARLDTMKANFFKDLEALEEEKWPSELKTEVAAKILDAGEAYRPLLASDQVHLVVGFTTDTLQAVPNTPERLDAIVDAVQELIERGNSSAYLRFSF